MHWGNFEPHSSLTQVNRSAGADHEAALGQLSGDAAVPQGDQGAGGSHPAARRHLHSDDRRTHRGPLSRHLRLRQSHHALDPGNY